MSTTENTNSRETTDTISKRKYTRKVPGKSDEGKKYDFMVKALKRHGSKYTYEKSIPVDSHKPIIITCPEHGDFTQSPSSHLRGRGCKKCNMGKQVNIQTIQTNLAKLGFSIGTKTRVVESDEVKIECPKHGNFLVKGKDLLSEELECPSCKYEKKVDI